MAGFDTQRQMTRLGGRDSGVASDGKELTGKIAYEIKSPTHFVFPATAVEVGVTPRKDIEVNCFKKSMRMPRVYG